MLTGLNPLDDRGVVGTELLSGGDPDTDLGGLSSSSSVGSRTRLFFFKGKPAYFFSRTKGSAS